MKIALIGTRGVPANYGGFETCVEELGSRLVRRGHSVTVYCRASYYEERVESYLGMDLVYLPNIRRKSLDTLSHTFLSTLHALPRRFDVLMFFNAANSPALVFPRLLGQKTALNPDGLEWKRGKWGLTTRKYYRFSEWLSSKLANRVVADSHAIQAYYRSNYGIDSSFIPYGAYEGRSLNPEMLREHGLEPNEYFLQITRFEPENNPLLTIQAYKQLATDKKLVLVGGNPYESDYSRRIKAEADCDGIVLTGFIYDRDMLTELWCNCYAYVHGNEVGGTNPALLQAMANGCLVVSLDVAFNREVLGDGGVYFTREPASLADKLGWAIENASDLADYRARAVGRIKERYCWDIVAGQYEVMFHEIVEGRASAGIAKIEEKNRIASLNAREP